MLQDENEQNENLQTVKQLQKTQAELKRKDEEIEELKTEVILYNKLKHCSNLEGEPQARSRTKWKDYMSLPAWELLDVSQS